MLFTAADAVLTAESTVTTMLGPKVSSTILSGSVVAEAGQDARRSDVALLLQSIIIRRRSRLPVGGDYRLCLMVALSTPRAVRRCT
jgi:hypothetical protein